LRPLSFNRCAASDEVRPFFPLFVAKKIRRGMACHLVCVESIGIGSVYGLIIFVYPAVLKYIEKYKIYFITTHADKHKITGRRGEKSPPAI